jgi:hypothetical protein
MKTIPALLILWFTAFLAPAQTTPTLYLRPLGDAHNCLVVGTGNSTPDQITCASAAPFSVGDRVLCANLSGDTAPNRDDLKVASVAGSTFTITDQSGAAIAGNGTWNNGDGSNNPGGAQICGKVQAYSMASSAPRLWTSLTHRSGIEMASKISNGLLTSIVVSGGIPTVNYAVSIASTGIAAGGKMGIWGSATSLLNGTYNIMATTATSVTLSATSAGDKIYTDSTLSVSAWAYTGNPAWDAITSPTWNNFSEYAALMAGATPSDPFVSGTFFPFETMAVRCYINEADTGTCTGALWGLNHFENITSAGSFSILSSATTVDDADLEDYGNRIGEEIARTYDLLQGTASHQLSGGDKTTFLNKVWNNLAGGCTKPTKNIGSGTITIDGSGNVIGAGTHFTSEIGVGYTFDSPTPTSGMQCLIDAVTDDTHAHCKQANASVPRGAYSIGVPFTAGQCGYNFWGGYNSVHFPGQPITQPPSGGSLSTPYTNQVPSHLGGLGALGLATCPDDHRGCYAAESIESFFADYAFPPISNWMTGTYGYGFQYDNDVGYWAWNLWQLAIQNAVVDGPDFAGLDLNRWQGPWTRYHHLPGLPAPPDAAQSLSLAYPPAWGGSGSAESGWRPYTSDVAVSSLASWLALNPTSAETAKFHYWLLNNDPYYNSSLTGLGNRIAQGIVFETAWPTIPATNFTSDPLGMLFAPTATQYNQCVAQGQQSWQHPCIPRWGYQHMISRSGWDLRGASQDTFLQADGSAYNTERTGPRYAETYLWKGDELIGVDTRLRSAKAAGDARNGLSSMWQIGTGLDQSSIDGISLQNFAHGVVSYAMDYGFNTPDFDRFSTSDAAGQSYTYGHLDFSSCYFRPGGIKPVVTSTREWAHLKTGNEYVFEYTYFDLTGHPNTIIGDFVHYQQNGEANEGNTTCPGSGGCASFSANQQILSLSTVSGVHSQFVPVGGTSRIYLDSTNGTYPGGLGHTFRVSGCAGTNSCSSSATKYEMVQVHKVFYGTADPGITVTPLNPDSNWTGVQTEDKVVLFARGATLHGSITSFATTHSGTAQYLIAGLAPQAYDVTLGGSPVLTGAVVSAGDNTLTFESAAGVISILPSARAPMQTDATTRFGFSATPPSVVNGVPFSFTVSAFDRFGNLAPSNTAFVRFTSSDGAAILPADSFMPAGVATFSAILKTTGTQNITVTDTGNSSVTGASTPIVVTGSASGNLAQGRPATQSSTYFGAPGAVASLAVDGKLDGNFFDGSVTATNAEPDPWWQVDLGASATVNSIVVWNRTDCCTSWLSDYWVFVSDSPFLSTDTPATLQNRAGTWSSHQTAAPNPSTIIAAGAVGRYVRVQIAALNKSTGLNILSLAEVQVFDTAVSPSGTSLATGRLATQSSTLPGYAAAGASAAADGNTGGNFFDGSVTATNLDPNAWWQVDLGASADINSIVIWNRTDCCGTRLNDFWVFISDSPFLSTDTPATLQNRAGTWSSHQTAAPNPSTTITAGAQGRYVRVQLSGANNLSLAEVQVFGIGGVVMPTNVARGKLTSQSSTLPGYASAGPASAVDGNSDGKFFDGSVTATNLDPSPWWQVDLGASKAISSIVIWNRTDCCGSRLADYWVFVSDTPFLPTDTPDTLQNRAGTFSSHQTSAPQPSATIAAGAQGRYVRVQLTGIGFLSLAEVQVFN